LSSRPSSPLPFSLGRAAALHDQALRRGYAVASYGQPRTTLGVGGAGGSIPQYAIAQNLPGVLGGLVPQYSYSDMITQAIHVGDCELLERYFDTSWTLSGHTSRWASGATGGSSRGSTRARWRIAPPGTRAPTRPGPARASASTAGAASRRSSSTRAGLPKAYFDALRLYRYPESVISGVKWDHWDELGNIYPKGPDGYAWNTADNVGVQYGLGSLRRRALPTAEFLELNACVGGWKQPEEMATQGCPRAAGRAAGRAPPSGGPQQAAAGTPRPGGAWR